VSRMNPAADDWRAAWPLLWRQVRGDELLILKRTGSGDVLAGRVTLGARDVDVIVKRPRRRYWYRYLNEVGRGSRPRRAWRKSWDMIVRGLPVAWPLLVIERRTLGYVTDAVLICERVPGQTLAHAPLDGYPQPQRDGLFHRTGK